MAEMSKLIKKLKEAHIPYEVGDCWGTPQVFYPDKKIWICDVICHKYSYGGKEGLLEIMGLVDEEKVGDSVEGYLTADEVFTRIFNHYYRT